MSMEAAAQAEGAGRVGVAERTAEQTVPVSGAEAALSASSGGHGEVSHQFEDIEQQNESYIVGMWTFLATEVMFFGGLFLAYTVYRWKYPGVFYEGHRLLDLRLGLVNTTILLTSSLFMALAVHYAQLRHRRMQLLMLGLVLLCAFAFLGIKAVEYAAKFEHHLVPGAGFQQAGPNAEQLQLFFGLYFAMTGLHGVHVVVGILVLGTILLLTAVRHPSVRDHIPIELAGLYWHFVDIVWIFLFPLFYLIPR